MDSLIELKQHEDLSLAEEVDRHWTEVFNQEYIFNRKQLEVDSTQASSSPSPRPCIVLTPVSRAFVHLARSSLSITKRKERDCGQYPKLTKLYYLFLVLKSPEPFETQK